MRTVPQRLAIVLALVLSFAFFVTPAGPAVAQTERKSITDLTPAELMSLRRGVATMMSRNTAARGSADFRRSWIYWANMHAHFGSDCRGAITGNGMNGVATWTARNAGETSTWCQCEHGTTQFLTWHRMFLYYFERVLRQAANDPNLTLPYWDYSTTPRLPAALRDATYLNENGRRVPNPLRIESRRAALNAGTAQLASSVTSSTNAMRATTRSQFETRIEATPHGAVHCAIAGGCPTGLMGSVPASALDPVFYLHHANIDRLYECWLSVNQSARLPTDTAILRQRYSFIDSNGTVRQRQVRDMLTLAQLGYRYPNGNCPQAAAPEAIASAAPAAMAMAAEPQVAPAPMHHPVASKKTELARGLTDVPITVEPSGLPAPGYGRPAAAKTATVTIEGVDAAVVPGVVYNVYLANAAGKRSLIGVISFFGFGGPDTGGAHDHEGGRTFDFDATDAVKSLGLAGAKTARLLLEPSTGLEGSTVQEATKAIPANAKVVFTSAKLSFK